MLEVKALAFATGELRATYAIGMYKVVAERLTLLGKPMFVTE